jgi:hypothetical protein
MSTSALRYIATQLGHDAVTAIHDARRLEAMPADAATVHAFDLAITAILFREEAAERWAQRRSIHHAIRDLRGA